MCLDIERAQLMLRNESVLPGMSASSAWSQMTQSEKEAEEPKQLTTVYTVHCR